MPTATSASERTRTRKSLAATARTATSAHWESRRHRVAALAAPEAPEQRGGSGSRRQNRRVRDTIVVEYLDLAEALARRYSHRGHDSEDLRQVAYLGLIKASERFDPRKGDDFVKFAVPTISGEIKRHLRDNGWVIRPPRHIQELRARATKSAPRLAQDLGRMPTGGELADALGESVEDVEEALNVGDSIRPASLDAPVAADETTTLVETLGGTDRDLERAETLAAIAPAFADLDARDKRILYLRFFEEQTQQEIAGQLGVTQMQVSRLLAKILGRLRQALQDVPLAS